MESVMHFSHTRWLCHDDIRAIRMVYDLPVKRGNAVYDDTCRRDFPMNQWQRWMYLLNKFILLMAAVFACTSAALFLCTLIYLLLQYLYNRRTGSLRKQRSKESANTVFTKRQAPKGNGKRLITPHGYLWHDEML